VMLKYDNRCAACRPTTRSILLLPDTHAHLGDDQFAADIQDVLRRAEQAGIGRILCVGSDVASSRRAIELARENSCVYAAVGMHPHFAQHWALECDELRTLLHEPKVVAVGEVGLDYVRDSVPREQQLAAFEQQIAWAEEMGLPVSVHNRSADADVIRTVDKTTTTAIMHCFGGDAGLTEWALDRGHAISFAGNVTFKNASALQAVARDIPVDSLLVESDSPVLAPQSHRGHRNEPAYVRDTATFIAGVRAVAVEHLSDAIWANADRVFGWGTA